MMYNPPYITSDGSLEMSLAELWSLESAHPAMPLNPNDPNEVFSSVSIRYESVYIIRTIRCKNSSSVIYEQYRYYPDTNKVALIRSSYQKIINGKLSYSREYAPAVLEVGAFGELKYVFHLGNNMHCVYGPTYRCFMPDGTPKLEKHYLFSTTEFIGVGYTIQCSDVVQLLKAFGITSYEFSKMSYDPSFVPPAFDFDFTIRFGLSWTAFQDEFFRYWDSSSTLGNRVLLMHEQYKNGEI